MTITDTLIKTSISMVSEQPTEVLSHTWKVFHSSSSPSQLKQLQPFLTAIEKELYKRRKVTPDQPQVEPQPDMYGDTHA